MNRVSPRLFAASLTTAMFLAAAALPGLATGATPSPVGATKLLSAQNTASSLTTVIPIASTANTSLIGSQFAVFERHNIVATTPDPTGDLIAVTATGKQGVFGEATPDMYGFSLAGYTLTAASDTDRTKVYWWHPGLTINAGLHGTGLVGTGKTYLSSAPDGWVEIAADGTLYDVDAPGGEDTARVLANPFGSSAHVTGISGPTGVVVWNDTKIAFVSFADGSVTPLDTSKLTARAGGTNTPQCYSVSANAAACGTYFNTGEDDSGQQNLFLDPLDGAPAYAENTTCPRPATMLAGTAAWATCNGQLRVMGAGTLVTSTTTIGSSPVAGLGGFLTTDVKHHAGLKIGVGAKQSTTVLAATRSVTEAKTFALVSGSVIWMQNDPGSAPATIHRRTVAPNAFHTAVTAGSSHKVGTSHAIRGTVSAAGKTIAYATNLTNSQNIGVDGAETLRVVTPSRTATIAGVDRYLPVSIGDHRILYFTDTRDARLYNLGTRKTTKLAITGGSLSGAWFAYCDTSGTIRLKNLETGKVSVVASGVNLNQGQLFLRGQVVAWNVYTNTGQQLGYYRDMTDGSAAILLPSDVNVWQASDAGLVLVHKTSFDANSSPTFPSFTQTRNHPGLTFSLQPYDGGAAATLLTADYPIKGPLVAAGIVAWIDQRGRLEARSLE